MKNIILIAISSMIFLQGCIEYTDDPICSNYKYITFEELRTIVVSQEVREIEDAGKIYVYENLLLVNEPYEGVHVIDNSDKNNPITKAFIQIPGNVDIAVKDGYMYVDSYMDLVVIDIRDIDNIQEVNRTIDLFSYAINYSDIEKICDFDTSKGVIVGVQK